MTDDISSWITAIAQNLAASFLAVIFGIAFTYAVRRRLDKRDFGGWRVIVRKQGKTEVDRDISVEKAKQILRESSDLAVFLKGVASPYDWITCDILQKGVESGLFVRDDQKRRLTVDLDRNEKPPSVNNAQILNALQQLAQHQGVSLADFPSAPAVAAREGGPVER